MCHQSEILGTFVHVVMKRVTNTEHQKSVITLVINEPVDAVGDLGFTKSTSFREFLFFFTLYINFW